MIKIQQQLLLINQSFNDLDSIIDNRIEMKDSTKFYIRKSLKIENK